LAGCGAAAPIAPRTARADEPFHDACREWGGERASATQYELEPRARPLLLPADEPEPDYELAPFNAMQATRIARVQALVRAASRAHDIPPDLVNGVIWVESQFQVRARSRAGANGLMQLMPRTGREVARELGRGYSPYDPEFNIHAGTYYLAQLLRRFDWNLRLALAAYNSGPATVESWLQVSASMPDYSRDYVNHVLIAARAFRTRLE
jgi:soluble lytic murein transglycosylase-like protein